MAKVQLGVIFGSRSCEREVSIISAVQLMNHADTREVRRHPSVYRRKRRLVYGECAPPHRDVHAL